MKAYLGITDTSEDPLIDDWILAAQAQIERYCNRAFDSATYTQYYDGNNKRSIVLRNTPVTSVTSISYMTAVDTYTAFDATTYTVNADSGVVQLASTWSNALWLAGIESPTGFQKGNKAIKAVYVGGYSTIPADLSQACIELVAKIRGGNASQRSARASGLQSESLGYESRTWGQMNAAEQFDWLTNKVGSYRRVAI